MSIRNTTLVVELLERRKGLVLSERSIVRALRGLGIDMYADIIGVRFVAGDYESLLATAIAIDRRGGSVTRLPPRLRVVGGAGDG